MTKEYIIYFLGKIRYWKASTKNLNAPNEFWRSGACLLPTPSELEIFDCLIRENIIHPKHKREMLDLKARLIVAMDKWSKAHEESVREADEFIKAVQKRLKDYESDKSRGSRIGRPGD